MTTNPFAINVTNSPAPLSWQRLMMWIILDRARWVKHLRGLRQWSVSALLLTAPNDEPFKWLYMIHLGKPTKAECAYVASRVHKALVEGKGAGRTLTRATLPEECRSYGPKRFMVGRQRVRVEWVDHHKPVGAWVKIKR